MGLTVRPFRFGPVRVDALRIEDERLSRMTDYKGAAATGVIFLVMAAIRAAVMFLL